MGTWVIQFQDDNAAFEDNPTGEISRILRELADKFENEGGPDCEYTSEMIRDINGNTVGRVTYYDDDEPHRRRTE